ncbi:uncharacterized protein LOC123467730 [Daphnia magna]|uniref:uncharacterized protein LOC123467730 n=1 Tax=Daphnia magna TaxID=35525 RepID=UPI001E1BAB94|nr:uncharacterized protein LOC123467730 [Daphnia magna]
MALFISTDIVTCTRSKIDSFIFDVKTDVKASTKRRILSAVSTLYDSLGFLSPVILSAKRILQELWLVGVDWDDQVPEWIATKTCRFQTFVANRISEILEHFQPTEWRHVPGIKNPADECSRGLIPDEMMENYHQGVSASNWIGLVYGPTEENRLRSLLERNSNYDVVMQIVSWILRFISNSKLKLLDRDKSRIGVKCIQHAANHCIKSAQLDIYSEEIEALKDKKSLKLSSTLITLSLFLDEEGILRVGGRLNYAPLSFDIKHPKILPHDHPLTRLIVMREHDLLFHPSPERLLSSIRSQYWIIKGRVAIKRYLHKCFTCKRHRATPCIPLMAPLPRHRLISFQRLFTHVSLDYFGPCNITIYRRKVKRYVFLITCLNTRAVHLEVAASLDLSSFFIAFASFAAQRGRPSVVYSDNGTQIVAGDKAIQQGIERLKKQNIVGQMVKQEIEWHISPPLAPHFGGVWESLVKSAKVALEAIVESRPLTEELLRGFVIQAESLLNGRPLTYVSVDPRDPEPLTPNHFLLVQSSPNTEDDVIEDEKLYSRKHWEALQVMTTHFCRRWLQ